MDALSSLVDNMNSFLDNQSKLISLVIIDYHIPSIDGLDVIKKAREKFAGGGVPFPKVVMLTAIEDERLRDACFRHKDVDYFFNKPAPVDEFE